MSLAPQRHRWGPNSYAAELERERSFFRGPRNTSSAAYGSFYDEHGDDLRAGTRGTYARAEAAFRHYDRNRSGFLDYRELRNALRHYGMDTSLRGAAEVLQAYDDRPDGRLDIHEFTRLVRDLEAGMIRADTADGDSLSSTTYASDAYGAPYGTHIPSRVHDAFRFFDRNRTGYLDYSELRNALRHYGIDASQRGAARLLATYDDRPDGRLDVEEFANLVRDLESGVLRAHDAYHHPSSNLYPAYIPARIRSVFAAYDADRNGALRIIAAPCTHRTHRTYHTR